MKQWQDDRMGMKEEKNDANKQSNRLQNNKKKKAHKNFQGMW